MKALENGILLACEDCNTYQQAQSNQDILKMIIGVRASKLADYTIAQLSRMTRAELGAIIGSYYAERLIACFELNRRKEEIKIETIRSSVEAAQAMSPILRDLDHEEFWILLLNRANKEIGRYKVGLGGVSYTAVDVKLIMKYAIVNSASSMVLYHNHPSGNTVPSQQDRELTKSIIKAADTFDIKVMDHIIIAGHSYYSFSDEGECL